MDYKDYKPVDVHGQLKPLLNEKKLKNVAEGLVNAGIDAGSVQYRIENTQIVQLPSEGTGPPFFVHGVPKRADRPLHPNAGSCPIALENVRRVGQHFVLVEILRWQLLMLANPYAYMPHCITWATAERLPQACGSATKDGIWKRVIETMLYLCLALEDHVVGFNADIGNSLDWLHLVSHRPPNGHGLYPGQQVAQRLNESGEEGVTMLGPDHAYPIDIWCIRFRDPAVATEICVDLIARWQDLGGEFASANCVAAMEDDMPVLYIVPRTRLLRACGWYSMPACLEMLGVFIAARDWEISRVRRGVWGYNHFWRVLASLRPPRVESLRKGV